MKHIGTTMDKVAIISLTMEDIVNLQLYLNSAEIRYREKGLEKALKECTIMDLELYKIWSEMKKEA